MKEAHTTEANMLRHFSELIREKSTWVRFLQSSHQMRDEKEPSEDKAGFQNKQKPELVPAIQQDLSESTISNV